MSQSLGRVSTSVASRLASLFNKIYLLSNKSLQPLNSIVPVKVKHKVIVRMLDDESNRNDDVRLYFELGARSLPIKLPKPPNSASAYNLHIIGSLLAKYDI